MTNQAYVDAALAYHADLLKGWSVKAAGEKPTGEMLHQAMAFGRPGLQTMALAMAMRPSGVTANQILHVCGRPQNNHRTAEINAGHFKRVAAERDGNGRTVYKVELSAKGIKRVEKYEARLMAAEQAGAVTDAGKGKPARVVAAKGKKRTSAARKPAEGTTGPHIAVADDGSTVTVPPGQGEAPQGDQPTA